MYFKRICDLIVISIVLKNGFCATEWPKCAEFRFKYDTTIMRSDELQFKQNLPTLFDSYDDGNLTSVENTLKTLQQQRIQLNYFDKQQLTYSDTVSRTAI